VDDSVLVVGELAANSVHRGGGAGLVRTWIEADHFVCEVHDAGRLDDPLAGRRPADGQQLSGRGLLVVNHLTDLVRMHTQPAGTTIRAYFQLVVPKTRFTSVDLRPRAGGRPAYSVGGAMDRMLQAECMVQCRRCWTVSVAAPQNGAGEHLGDSG
jgi:hypothetical protein